MNIQQFFQSISESLRESATVKVVYGEPISAEDKTIIPVAKVAYGFGGGAGTREKGQEDDHDEEAESGGGGGGGVSAKPVGVVEITSENTRFISFVEKKKLVGAMLLGFFVGIFIGKMLPGDKT